MRGAGRCHSSISTAIRVDCTRDAEIRVVAVAREASGVIAATLPPRSNARVSKPDDAAHSDASSMPLRQPANRGFLVRDGSHPSNEKAAAQTPNSVSAAAALTSGDGGN